MQLLPIPPHLLPDALPDFERWLAPITSRPGATQTLSELLGIVRRGEGQHLALLDAAGLVQAQGVAQVRDYGDGRRECWVLGLGGRRVGSWSDVLRQIEDGARRNGCQSVEFVGRRAWKRILPRYTAEPCEFGTHYSLDLRH